jgi:protein arginine N-methyltransferase 1/protein arginine N-methyltransferase 6
MVYDGGPNPSCFNAIEERIDAMSAVLDLGAGVGVLGLEAARRGARKAYVVGSAPEAHLGRELADANDCPIGSG